MIKEVRDLKTIQKFIIRVYNETICGEDTIEGRKNFIGKYVEGAKTKEQFESGFEKYYGYFDESMLGIISINNEGYIKFLFVDEKCQGLGIGKKLLDYVTKVAIENNIDQISLDSSVNGVKFYEKQGFVRVSEAIKIDDIIVVPMKKILK